jgi:DNA repair protein RadA/Sms
LGFKRAIVPKGQSLPDDLGLEIITVGKVIDAIVAAIPHQASLREIEGGDEIYFEEEE